LPRIRTTSLVQQTTCSTEIVVLPVPQVEVALDETLRLARGCVGRIVKHSSLQNTCGFERGHHAFATCFHQAVT